jgi:hypothetical protein
MAHPLSQVPERPELKLLHGPFGPLQRRRDLANRPFLSKPQLDDATLHFGQRSTSWKRMVRCSIASSPASGISAASPVSRAVFRQWSAHWTRCESASRKRHAPPLELRQAGERLLEHRRRDVLGRRTVARAATGPNTRWT